MFVYSMRASTLKFFGVVSVALAALIVLIAFVPTYDAEAADGAAGVVAYRYEKIKSDDDVESFLTQFGWQVGAQPQETVEVTIPSEFDKIFTAYNEIQKRQGLNLSPYKRKTVKRYTYVIENYPDYEGKVYANVLVYRGKVIGGDICSADVDGFIHGFEKEQKNS